MDVGPLADKTFRSLELHDQIVVETSVDGALIAARSLDQHADGPACHGGGGGKGELLLRFQQAVHAGGLLSVGRWVGQLGRRGAGALGIDEGKQLHIAHLTDEVERCGKVLLRLAGEADNDVAGEGHTGNFFLGVADQIHVLRDVVVAVHLLEQPVRAGLHGQVDMLAQMLLRGNRVDELAAGVLRMARHEADLVVAGDFAQQVQKVGKVDGMFQPLAVAVDVLAQEGDLLIALLDKLPELCQNCGGLAAALPPADVGHDAVGAEVVAPVHDGQPRAEAGIAADGQLLDHGVALGGLFQIALALADALGQHGGQPVNAVHAKDKVHIGVALAQLFDDVLLLGHAAADTDHQARVLLLELFQRADIAENALLGVLTHGAGVEQDEVGVFDIVTQAVADILQNALDLLAVVDVLLAAVAAYIRQRRCLIERRQRLGGGIVVGVGQFFQVNFSLYKRPNGHTYPNIPY